MLKYCQILKETFRQNLLNQKRKIRSQMTRKRSKWLRKSWRRIEMQILLLILKISKLRRKSTSRKINRIKVRFHPHLWSSRTNTLQVNIRTSNFRNGYQTLKSFATQSGSTPALFLASFPTTICSDVPSKSWTWLLRLSWCTRSPLDGLSYTIGCNQLKTIWPSEKFS